MGSPTAYIDYYWRELFSFLILILAVLAVSEVIKSNRPPSSKILWSLLILLFPIVGLIIYLVVNDKERRRLRYVSIP